MLYSELALILALIVSIAFAEVARTLRAWNSTKMLLVLPSVARDASPCPSWCLSESIIEALSCRGRKEGRQGRVRQGKQQSNSREKTATEITTQGNRQGVEAPLEWEQREQREQLVEQQLQLPEMRYKSQDINSGTRASSSFVVGRSEISQAKYALGVQSGELQMLL